MLLISLICKVLFWRFDLWKMQFQLTSMMYSISSARWYATFSKYRMMSHKNYIYRLQIFESCWIQSHQIILHSKYIVVQCKFKTQQNIIHANVCMRFTRWWKMRTPWTGYSHSNNNRNLDLCRVLHNIFYIMLLIIAWNRNRRIILYATEVF